MAEIESRLFSEEFYAATRTALGAMEVEVNDEVDSLVGNKVEIETQQVELRDKYNYSFDLRHTTYRGDVIPESTSELIEVVIESPSREVVRVSLLPCDGTVFISTNGDKEVDEQDLSLIPGFVISAANETRNDLEDRLKNISHLAYHEYKKQYDECAETGDLRSDFQVDMGSYDNEKYQTIDIGIYELDETLYTSVYIRIDDDTTVTYELNMEDFTLCTWVDDDDIVQEVTNQIKHVLEFERLASILLS